MLLLLACPEAGTKSSNSEASAEILFPLPGANVVEGEDVLLRGVVRDADDPTSALNAAWILGSTELCPATPPAEDGTTTCLFTMPPHALELKLAVLDPHGGRGSAILKLDVLGT